MRPRPWVTAGLLLLAGIGQACSVALPWTGQSAWWLQLLTLGLLVAGLEGASSSRVAAWRGWLFAWAWYCASFWWLYISLHVYGGLPSILAVFAVALLAGALALYLSLAAAAYHAWAPAGLWFRASLFAGLCLLAELARARWLTGFPWGASGYAHIEGPLAPLAPWIGSFGMGAVAAWLAALVGISAMRPGRFLGFSWRQKGTGSADGPAAQAVRASPDLLIGLGATVLVLGLVGNFGESFTQSAGKIDVALLQGNIPQDEKFIPGSGVAQALRWYREQLLLADQDLVVAPETAIPLLVEQLPPGYWESLLARFSTGSQAALIGIPARNAGHGYSNSVVGLRPGGGASYRYDKHHLVPFGEFIPPFFRWFTAMMNIPLGDFSRGSLNQASFEWKGQRIAPNVCYEDLFGEELAQRFTDDSTAPTLLANVSNIAWFGNSIAIDQHLNISRMRALEFQRPFIRATNTGATAIIDHRGQISQALPRHTRGVLRGQVEGRTGRTPYAKWAAWLGMWPFWLLGVAVVLAAGFGRTWGRSPAQRA